MSEIAIFHRNPPLASLFSLFLDHST